MNGGAPELQGTAHAEPPRAELSAAPVRACFRFAFRYALLVFAVDAFSIVRAGDLGPARGFLLGLMAALFRGLIAALALAGGVGALVWLHGLWRFYTRRPPLAARAANFLFRGTAERQRVRAGALLALPLTAAAAAGAAFLLDERLITGMARPEFTALALVGGDLVLVLAAWLCFPALAALTTSLTYLLEQLPWLGPRAFARTWHYALWISLLGLVALAGFAIHYRTPLSYLPWRSIWQLVLPLPAAGLLGLALSRLPEKTRKPRRALAAALLLASLVCAQAVGPQALRARQIAERETLSGRIGQAALLYAWDRDRDGYLPFLGGGDCAPNDPRRNPAANDIPGNGIDEDCDGSDLDLRASPPRGEFDYPISSAVPQRPPIVLVTVDTFAASHTGALGYDRPLTPNIDAFAARSVFFTACFAQGPSTRLSFPSIFTSRWDTQIEQQLTGRHPFPIGPHETLLAQTMQAAGYDTAAILPDAYFSPRYWQGITRGFERIDESPFTTAPALPHNGGRVTDAALAEIRRPRDKPLFLWVHYYDAHSPFEQPPGVPAYGTARRDLYDAELNFVDRELGRLLAGIDKELAGKAVVVLTGDHGVAFDEPRHQTFNYGYDLYTTVLHVPLIVHAPFLGARRMDGVVSTMDIVPTLANLLRLHGPARYEGMSLVPELFSGKRSRPPELMHQFFLEERLWKREEPLEKVSLRTDTYDLIDDRKTGFFELYAWRKDYLERHDLAFDPAYQVQLAALKKQLSIMLYSAQHASELRASAQKAQP